MNKRNREKKKWKSYWNNRL